MSFLWFGLLFQLRNVRSMYRTIQGSLGTSTNNVSPFFFYSRPMSGIRMMIDYCKRWRMVILKKWLHCWVKREPVPPNKIARAKLRKSNLNLWFMEKKTALDVHDTVIKHQGLYCKWRYFHLKHNIFWKASFWWSIFIILHLKFRFIIRNLLR